MSLPGGHKKMHSATSSEGLRLVRTVGPCAYTRVTIETHSQTRALQSTYPACSAAIDDCSEV